MGVEEIKQVMETFSDMCDQAKACISGKPYVSSSYDFTKAAESVSVTEGHGPVGVDGCSEEELKAMVATCSKCRLAQGRHHAVYGEGVVKPLVMVIGEGPGADEDATGRPFVGRAGQYLDKWLASIGLFRDKNAYIANIVKCRPPENRTPEVDEIASCLPYVKRQIALVEPKLILLSGATAAHALLGRMEGVGRLREQTFSYGSIPMVVTYHPSGVLRNPEFRRPVWEDMKRIARMLGIPIPGRG